MVQAAVSVVAYGVLWCFVVLRCLFVVDMFLFDSGRVEKHNKILQVSIMKKNTISCSGSRRYIE